MKKKQAAEKLSAELGDWLLRCNEGEGMSKCVCNLKLLRTNIPLLTTDAPCTRGRRSDIDFMFQFFRKLAAEGLQVTDLRFSSQSTFRAYVDGLCGQAGSGWQSVSLDVNIEGFPELVVRSRPLLTVVYLCGSGSCIGGWLCGHSWRYMR